MAQTLNSQSTLLAIDTSTPACSAAILHQGEITLNYEAQARKHTQMLLPMIDALLKQVQITSKDIEGILLSAGPGAFTGLRVGASMAMGIASAYQSRIGPISSLALLAATAGAHHQLDKVIALMDARMSEVYAGLYVLENGHWINRGTDRVCAPEALPQAWFGEQTLIAGSGLVYLDKLAIDSELQSSLIFDESIYPLASHLFDFVELVSWQSATQGVELHYLRNEVTQA